MASPLVDHVGLYHCGLDYVPAGVWLAHVRIRARRPGSYRIYVFGFPSLNSKSHLSSDSSFFMDSSGSVPCDWGCDDCHASPDAR